MNLRIKSILKDTKVKNSFLLKKIQLFRSNFYKKVLISLVKEKKKEDILIDDKTPVRKDHHIQND